jgi:hypothetical protein
MAPLGAFYGGIRLSAGVLPKHLLNPAHDAGENRRNLS